MVFLVEYRAQRQQLPAPPATEVTLCLQSWTPQGSPSVFFEAKALNQKAVSQDGFSWAIQLSQSAY